MSNSCSATITRQNADNTWTFIIPRSFDEETIIGGTKEAHDWDDRPSLEVREILLSAAASMYSAITNRKGQFDVITDMAGRRPTRDGGTRLEIEDRQLGCSGDGPVVHAYGAGVRGFELNIGVAQEVYTLVKDICGFGSDAHSPLSKL